MTPHLFMTPAQIQTARTGPVDAIQAQLRQAVLLRADQALTEQPRYLDPLDLSRSLPALRPWPTEREGDTGELLKIRLDARDVQVLAVAYALTGRRAYAEKAWANLHAMLSVYEAFGSFHPVRKNNDLAAAEAYRAIAMAWDLCGEVRPAETRALILSEGVRRAREMYATAVRDWRINGLPVPFDTPGVAPEKGPDNRNIFAMLMTNHCWVNIGSLGLLGMALKGEDVAAAGPGSTPTDWLRFARHFFAYLAEIMPPDGSYPESRVYGAPYGEEGTLPFLRALSQVTGENLFTRTPFFRNIAYARLYAVWDHRHHRGVSNFGEGGDSEWQSAAWIYTTAALARDPILQWSANQWTRAGLSPDDLALQYLAYDPSLSEQAPEAAGLPLVRCLPDMSEVYLRGGMSPWGAESTVFSFRGSITGKRQYQLKEAKQIPYVTAWHSHESRNAVLLAVGGRALIGRATRGEPGTQCYSVLQVNGKDQREPDRALEGIQDFDTTDTYVTFSNEIGPAYEDLTTYRRRVVYLPPDTYLLFDYAKAKSPARLEYRLHFGRAARVKSDASSHVIGDIGEGEQRVPFQCEVLSRTPLTTALNTAPGRNAGYTLCYGPPDLVLNSQVIAYISLHATPSMARSTAVTSAQPYVYGVIVTGSPSWVVVAADAGDISASPTEVRYILPHYSHTTHHLIAGIAPGNYQITAHVQQDVIEIRITPGTGFASNERGTLLFQVHADGTVSP